jgi:hypothetical protein
MLMIYIRTFSAEKQNKARDMSIESSVDAGTWSIFPTVSCIKGLCLMISKRMKRTSEIQGCSGTEARNVDRILNSYSTT